MQCIESLIMYFFLPNNTEIKTQKSRLQYFKRLQKAKSVQTQKKNKLF